MFVKLGVGRWPTHRCAGYSATYSVRHAQATRPLSNVDKLSKLLFYLVLICHVFLCVHGWSLAPLRRENCINDHIDKNQELAAAQSDRTAEGEIVDKPVELNTYTEKSGIVEKPVISVQKAAIPEVNPYLKADNLDSLLRQYRVGTVNWSSEPAGTCLATFNFLEDLRNASQWLKDKLNYMIYYRAGVEIELRVNSTKFDYGALLVCGLPCYAPFNSHGNFDFRTASIFTASQNRPKILSIQQGKTLKIVIPWVHYRMWGYITDKNGIGSFWIYVLHPLTSVGTDPPTAVVVNVYARLVDLEVGGYAPSVASVPGPRELEYVTQSHGDVKTSTYKSHSAKESGTVAAEAKLKSHVISGVKTAVKTVDAIMSSFGNAVGAGLDMVAHLAPFMALTGLSKPTSVANTEPMEMVPEKGMSHIHGTSNARKISMTPEAVLSVAPGLCGRDGPSPKLLDVLKVPTLMMYGKFDNTTAVDTLIFSAVASPSYWNNLGTTGGSTAWHGSYMAYYAQFFRYWRGDIKFYIRFTTSSFVSCRVRLVHLVVPITGTIAGFTGDLPTKVVDIAGDTEEFVTIPWNAQDAYETNAIPPATDTSNGWLSAYLETPIVSTEVTADPPVYYSIWVAAGDNFQFMDLISTHTNVGTKVLLDFETLPAASAKKARGKKKAPASNTPLVTQCDVGDCFQKPFHSLADAKSIMESGICSPESVVSITDMLHRYWTYTEATIVAGTGTYTWIPYPSGGTNVIGQGYYYNASWGWKILAPFRNWRGSTRGCLLAPLVAASQTTVFGNSGSGNDPYASGFVVGENSNSGWLAHWERPSYNKYMYHESCSNANIGENPGSIVDTGQSLQINASAVGGVVGHALMSFGDDLSLGELSATPPLWIPD